MSQSQIPTPYYIVYEERLRRNLELITTVQEQAGIKIIMAFKANALWKSFPIIKKYIQSSTASSLNEMRLSLDYLGHDVHTYCPVYSSATFPEFLEGSSHITFNSIAQYHRFASDIARYNAAHPLTPVSAGLRVNPQCSVIETDIYNPCLPGSRFGESAQTMPEELPEGLEGLHFHALCESSSYDLEKVIEAFEAQFGPYIDKVKWVNMGGGHLMTKAGYDTDHLVKVLKAFRSRHNGVEVILEPGSAFTWRTGDLIASVLDIVENSGIKTAILDTSFACHMPDCLEMPYTPTITEALPEGSTSGFEYRLGGNSCLSGDFMTGFHFPSPLHVGQRLTFEDMNHYTTVKTHMFNGIQHPSIWLQPIDGEPQLLRQFTYEDYRDRMD